MYINHARREVVLHCIQGLPYKKGKHGYSCFFTVFSWFLNSKCMKNYLPTITHSKVAWCPPHVICTTLTTTTIRNSILLHIMDLS